MIVVAMTVVMIMMMMMMMMSQGKSQNTFVGSKKLSNESISKDELLRIFHNPPLDYGPIDCWWLEAEHLTKDRMTWQLEEMKAKGVAGTWLYQKYVQGQSLGPTPPYWTDEWWDFVRFSLEEQKRLGMTQWCNDWLGRYDKQYWYNQIAKERDKNPSLTGRRLVIHEKESSDSGVVLLDIPAEEEIIYASAYRKLGDVLDYASKIDLMNAVQNNKLAWEAKEAGWLVSVVTSQPNGLDYLNKAVVNRWFEIYLGVYEKKLPDFMGSFLKAYGPDEMSVLNGNILYSPSFSDRFKAGKGYDPLPYLVGLFHDIGQKTDKIRCDYYDVMVSIMEENFYKPTPQWLHDHGMMYNTIATWGREDMLGQTYNYGDFFRMMRCFDITGNEDSGVHGVGDRCFIDGKLSSSVAHIYQKERTAVCAYWGAGWGMTTEQNLAWTNENYAYGMNLYNQHGVLYTLLGGWYEFVPPEVHFVQPYWQYWKHFTDYVTRLSYIMSQGTHQADVALLYPLTTIHANWSGGHDFSDNAKESATTTFNLAKIIYKNGIDFDFIDDTSLCNGDVDDKKLDVSGIKFHAIVLPPMTTIITETLEKIKEFYDNGGTVIAFHRLPNASQENGRDDPYIRSLIKGIFGVTADDNVISQQENKNGGKAFFLPDNENSIPEIISNAIVTDVVASEKDIFHTHQKIGDINVYFLFNVKPEKRNITFTFRVCGEPEIWDSFTGETKPVHRFESQDDRTKVRLDMEAYEGVLLVFDPSKNTTEVLEDNLTTIAKVEHHNANIEIQGFDNTGGKKKALVRYNGKEYVAEAELDTPPTPITLDGDWGFSLEPTMDNKWGDFRYPPSEEYIGAEARRFRYMEETGIELGWHELSFDDSSWQEVTHSYGPYWWTIGPFEEGNEPKDLIDEAQKIEPDKQYELEGNSYQWQRYSFSQKYGCEEKGVQNKSGDGLKGVSEDFLVFDAVENIQNAVRYLFTYVYSPDEKDYVFDFGEKVNLQAWINGEQVMSVTQKTIRLKDGWNSVLLKLVQPKGEKIETYAVFHNASNETSSDPYFPLLRWFVEPQDLIYDITPQKEKRVGWYRFDAPPGLKSMKLNLNAHGVQAWIDGQPVKVDQGMITLESPLEGVSQVALRVEQKSGCYAGAVFSLPVSFECEEGNIPLGDWCDYGLKTYSGGVIYTKIVSLGKHHLSGKVLLDLGQVNTTAEVHVNGVLVGVRMGRPFLFDVTHLVSEGDNRIQVKVVNTLANHMSTYPTNYVYDGQTISGLLGPVTLQFLSKVTLTASPIKSTR
jgi:hypothetical protein